MKLMSEDRVGPEKRQRQNTDGRAVKKLRFACGKKKKTFKNKLIQVIFLVSQESQSLHIFRQANLKFF